MVNHSQITLSRVFTLREAKRAWKDTVRQGFRTQILLDLHDYMDFHLELDKKCEELVHEVCIGSYIPGISHLMAVEKSNGIIRRLWLPTPRDAVALQVIVNALEPWVKEAQPSDSAFYARSHSNPPTPERIDGTFAYPWWLLWPEFQKRILGFAKTCQYLVTTDIANYFDTIPLSKLRVALARVTSADDSLLSLLFLILESFVVRVGYTGLTGVGIPQLEFDAPRLLAHLYVFPVDEYLDKATGHNFVRWVDDMDFGVQSCKDAYRIIRHLDELLYTRGLRINGAKTQVLTAKRAAQHFWALENRNISILMNLAKMAINEGLSTAAIRRKVTKSYSQFRRRKRTGHWDKVTKRYLNLFGMLGDDYMAKDVWGFLEDVPALRGSCCRYLEHIGYRLEHLRKLLRFIGEVGSRDDSSPFCVARVVVNWEIPLIPKPRRIIVTHLRMYLNAISTDPQSTAGFFLAALWLAIKYGTPSLVRKTILAGEEMWEKSNFLARQVAAAAARVLSRSDQLVLEGKFGRRGLEEGLAVLDHIRSLQNASTVSNQLRQYLLVNGESQTNYPLSKLLIATDVLRSKLPRSDKVALAKRLVSMVNDAYYRTMISNALRGRAILEVGASTCSNTH